MYVTFKVSYIDIIIIISTIRIYLVKVSIFSQYYYKLYRVSLNVIVRFVYFKFKINLENILEM